VIKRMPASHIIREEIISVDREDPELYTSPKHAFLALEYISNLNKIELNTQATKAMNKNWYLYFPVFNLKNRKEFKMGEINMETVALASFGK
jgi:hypothetical protein